MNIDSVKLGPIRHERLPPDLERRVRALYQYFGPDLACAPTYEQFEID